MEQTNVISLEEMRKQRANFKTRDEYSRYLQSLTLEQLSYEQNFLVNEVAHKDESEFFIKGPVLMGELARRLEGPQKEKVIELKNRFEMRTNN